MTRLALPLTLFLSLVPASIAESPPDAAKIMARVAENQDRAVEQRKEFVYRQKARVRLLKSNGKLVWDETREYNVTPTPEGTEFELTRRFGERRQDRELESFDLLDESEAEGIDPELVDEFHDDLTAQGDKRDGLSANFFPLTSTEQAGYSFTLEGEEKHRGRQVYRIRFEPERKPRLREVEDGRRIWKGEVLVDQEEFQPVFIATQMALNIPLPVRLLFGISIRQVGFSVSYQRFSENVWFPVSYGGEFFLKVLHFYKRNIIVSMASEDFRRTTVGSAVRFEEQDTP
ncbi:MAG: hypothetical protein WD733_04570 [Bryobacterales bacterium]